MEHSPTTPLGAHTPHAHPAYVPVISALVGAIIVASYLVIANTTGIWPFSRPATPEPVASASPTPEIPVDAPVGWKVYQSYYGFAFAYPPSAELNTFGEGYPSLTLKEEGVMIVQTGMGTVGYDDYTFTDVGVIRMGTLHAYTAPGNCHGLLAVIPDGGEGDRDFLVFYDDCYVGGGNAGFPNATQTAMFKKILDTFQTEASAQSTEEPSPAGADWRVYSDDAREFSFWYPEYYVQKTSLETGAFLYTPADGGGSFSVLVVNESLTGADLLYSGFTPLSELQKTMVGGRTAYTYREGDAGCGGDTYLMALTDNSYVKMEFGDCEGEAGPGALANAPAIMASFRFGATPGPVPTATPASLWPTFSSTYFTLSFRLPPDPAFTFKDEPNMITIMRDNTLVFRIQRYDAQYTKASAVADFRQSHTVTSESDGTVDGIRFPAKYASTGASLILFDKSALLVEDNLYSWTIVQTIRFSK